MMTSCSAISPTRLFLHYLRRLEAILKQAEAHGGGIEEQRLHPDMFPLLQQARIAIGFSLRATCPLAGRDIVSFRAGDDCTFSTIHAELERTMAYLAAIPDADFAGIDTLHVRTTAGFADLGLSGPDYFMMYAVPNFFFHYSMVYAIARQAGAEIGKSDFDGFHHYPTGFTFAEQ